MSWFTPEAPKRLFCETCKAHIEKATFTGTVLEEGVDRNGYGTGFYAVKRLAFCARCEPEHDIVIVRRDHFEHIRLDTRTRTLTDPSSKAIAANATGIAVVEALEAARKLREAISNDDGGGSTPIEDDGELVLPDTPDDDPRPASEFPKVPHAPQRVVRSPIE